MPSRIECPTVKEQYKPVAAGYELQSLEHTRKVERKGVAPAGPDGALGECSIEACGGGDLVPDHPRWGVKQMWVTLW